MESGLGRFFAELEVLKPSTYYSWLKPTFRIVKLWFRIHWQGTMSVLTRPNWVLIHLKTAQKKIDFVTDSLVSNVFHFRPILSDPPQTWTTLSLIIFFPWRLFSFINRLLINFPLKKWKKKTKDSLQFCKFSTVTFEDYFAFNSVNWYQQNLETVSYFLVFKAAPRSVSIWAPIGSTISGFQTWMLYGNCRRQVISSKVIFQKCLCCEPYRGVGHSRQTASRSASSVWP